MNIVEASQLLGSIVIVPKHGSVVLDAVRKDGICEVSGGYYVRVEDVVGQVESLVPESKFDDFSDEDLVGLLESRRNELGEEKFVEVFGGVLPNKGIGSVFVKEDMPPVPDSSSFTANSKPLESQMFESPVVSPDDFKFDGGDDGNFGDL